MPKNLRNKIFNLLEDMETLNKYEKADKLERFLKEELKFLESEHVIGKYDLTYIQSNAVQAFNDHDPRRLGRGSDLDAFRAWCYTEAIISFLRQHGLTAAKLKYDQKK